MITNPELEHEFGGTTESTDSASTEFVDQGEAETSGSEGGMASEASEASGTSEGETGNASEDEAATSADMPGDPLCELAGEVADGCQTCVDLHCCDVVTLCNLDEGCLCLLDCLLGGDSNALCQLSCGLDPQLPSLLMTLDCLDQHCPESCPSLP
ncbi:hypothetical protein ACNOYE_25845 [Nannocystaceae bacterium ST9]